MKESSLTAQKNPIDINDAVTYAKLWQKNQSNNCKAFLIPAEDLIDTLEEMGVIKKTSPNNYSLGDVKNSGVRAYMGIDTKISDGGGEKLLIVGTYVDCNGVHRDIIQNSRSTGCPTDGILNPPGPTGSGVYDLTTPCPNTCDGLSPLIY
nr:hypothetical protein [uncultured Psychroserpens sp.]